MPRGLDEKQNESIRRFVRDRLFPMYDNKQGRVAEAINYSPNAFSDFMRGKRGGSLALASVLAALTGTDPFEVLGAVPERPETRIFAMVPGFDAAVRIAVPMYPDVSQDTWLRLRRLTAPEDLVGPLMPGEIGPLALALQRLRWR